MVIKYAIKTRYVEMLKIIAKRRPSIREITKKNKSSYIHNRQVLEYCQEKGYIKPIFGIDREGKRDFQVELTTKGKIVLSLFYALEKIEETKTKKDLVSFLEGLVRSLASMKGRLR